MPEGQIVAATTPDHHATNGGDNLSHLDRLESDSIRNIREAVAEFQNPVMLYSIGRDSAVMLLQSRASERQGHVIENDQIGSI